MFFVNKPHKSRYRLIENVEERGQAERPEILPFERQRKWMLLLAVLTCCIAFALFVIGFVSDIYVRDIPNWGLKNDTTSSAVCKDPPLRKEWRSLDRIEKHDYIKAVKCLKTMPSQVGQNQTLYDDLPWVHMHYGEYSHDAAPFLAWHRYFIHVYERMLREQCGYQGQLAYWDWTLDWENITTSPIWDTDTGFGGDGNSSVGSAVFNAYCVTEGPFAHLEVPYYEHIYQPHCLLRGFDVHLEDFRDQLKPEALEKLLLSADYDTINLGLENGPHVAIPKSINGDFSLHTAPSDPVFFLHHTQLDRMWWRWQLMDPSTRSIEYTGIAKTNSTDVATLRDLMPMGSLAPTIQVSNIMSTESDLLCYTY